MELPVDIRALASRVGKDEQCLTLATRHAIAGLTCWRVVDQPVQYPADTVNVSVAKFNACWIGGPNSRRDLIELFRKPMRLAFKYGKTREDDMPVPRVLDRARIVEIQEIHATKWQPGGACAPTARIGGPPNCEKIFGTECQK